MDTIIAVCLICGIITAYVAQRLGKSERTGFLVGALTGPLGLLYIYLHEDKRRNRRHRRF